MEMIHPSEVLSVAMEYTRILVRDIALSFLNSLEGLLGNRSCSHLAHTAENL